MGIRERLGGFGGSRSTTGLQRLCAHMRAERVSLRGRLCVRHVDDRSTDAPYARRHPNHSRAIRLRAVIADDERIRWILGLGACASF